nr:PREDICTED: EPIDERMAL PATTERNING FACTOR-like protein 2 [Daucus carota subsp. sativus]
MAMASSEVPRNKKMKGRRFILFVVIMILLHIESCVCVLNSSGRPFFPDHAPTVQQTTGTKQNSWTSETSLSSEKEVMMNKLLGSIPPSCEHKCYGCTPCEATQVPTTKANLEIQSANYQPEGWKCKCGPSFYGP